jgi:hypothetical protein
VGFAIVDTRALERIEKTLRWERTCQQSEELWANVENTEQTNHGTTAPQADEPVDQI